MNWTRVDYKFTINNKFLYINENGEYSGIPENCPECHCVQDVNYRDFTNKTVQVCEQCGTKMYLSYETFTEE